jgi:hypothetical protein
MLQLCNKMRFKTLYCHDGDRGGKLMRAIRWANFTRNFLRSELLAETLVFITTEQSFQAPGTASYNDLRLPICNKRNQKEDIIVNWQYVIYEIKCVQPFLVDNHKKKIMCVKEILLRDKLIEKLQLWRQRYIRDVCRIQIKK